MIHHPRENARTSVAPVLVSSHALDAIPSLTGPAPSGCTCCHILERTHVCSKCQRRFSVVSNMKRHYKTCGLGKRSIHRSTLSKSHVQSYPPQFIHAPNASHRGIDQQSLSLPPIALSPVTAVYPSTSILSSITSQHGMSWSAPSTSLARLSQTSTPYSTNNSPHDADDHTSRSSHSISPTSYVSSPDHDKNPYMGYTNTSIQSQGHPSYVPPAPRIVYSDGTIAPSLASLPPLRSQIPVLTPPHPHSHHNRALIPLRTHPSTSSYSPPTPIVVASPSHVPAADLSPPGSLPPYSSLPQNCPIDNNYNDDRRSPEPYHHPFSGRVGGASLSSSPPPPLPAHLQQRRSMPISNDAFPGPTLASPLPHLQPPLHSLQAASSPTSPLPTPVSVFQSKSQSSKSKTAKEQAQPRTRRRWIPHSLSHFKNADTLSSSGPFKYKPSGGPGTSTITAPLQPIKPRGRPIPLGGPGSVVSGNNHAVQIHDGVQGENTPEQGQGEEWEERDSYDTTVPREPYHSKSWRERLPGPGLLPADEFVKDARRARNWVVLT
ncbi:hypothetical protein BS47DRAFT_320163 [Hydnum rufescens UP504]|uniref:C2H2-type domain-containing protein n=1 Tax=Hydnum rufescens UP504 TaxID=1448309 RepID=A0A9P6AK85_9AGAM|nr:hypothetical protein BS47DRAFT_320163 [Hydnum rufescens UP504]